MIVDDVLKKAASKKEQKKTSMVEVSIPPGILTKHKVNYTAAQIANAALAESEEELLGHVKPQYVSTAKEDYVGSVKVVDGSTEATISWKDAYCKIPVEEEDAIKEIVGDKYDKYFTEVNEIVVREDVAANPELLKELIEAVGPDTFNKFFDVAQKIQPKTSFTKERYREFSSKQNEDLDTIVKQYKPSVRLNK